MSDDSPREDAVSGQEQEIQALNDALYEAMEGQLRMEQVPWNTMKAIVNLRAVSERLYLRGVRTPAVTDATMGTMSDNPEGPADGPHQQEER